MSFVLMIDPTVTGGTSTTLTLASNTNGNAVYLFPSNTHLAPARISLATRGPIGSKDEPGTARSQAKLTFGSKESKEGCCGLTEGYVIFDMTARWNLNQDVTVLDSALAAFRAYVMSEAFESSIKTGILPA